METGLFGVRGHIAVQHVEEEHKKEPETVTIQWNTWKGMIAMETHLKPDTAIPLIVQVSIKYLKLEYQGRINAPLHSSWFWKINICFTNGQKIVRG